MHAWRSGFRTFWRYLDRCLLLSLVNVDVAVPITWVVVVWLCPSHRGLTADPLSDRTCGSKAYSCYTVTSNKTSQRMKKSASRQKLSITLAYVWNQMPSGSTSVCLCGACTCIIRSYPRWLGLNPGERWCKWTFGVWPISNLSATAGDARLGACRWGVITEVKYFQNQYKSQVRLQNIKKLEQTETYLKIKSKFRCYDQFIAQMGIFVNQVLISSSSTSGNLRCLLWTLSYDDHSPNTSLKCVISFCLYALLSGYRRQKSIFVLFLFLEFLSVNKNNMGDFCPH